MPHQPHKNSSFQKKKKKIIANLKKNKNNNKNQISICLDPRSSFQFFFFHAFSTFWDNYRCSRTVAALFTHCSWHITWLIKYFNCYLKCHVNLIKIHHARKKKIELLILKKIKTITKINLVFVWIHVHVFSFFFFFSCVFCFLRQLALFTHCSWHITWLIKYFNCYLKCHINLIKIHHARKKKKIELII